MGWVSLVWLTMALVHGWRRLPDADGPKRVRMVIKQCQKQLRSAGGLGTDFFARGVFENLSFVRRELDDLWLVPLVASIRRAVRRGEPLDQILGGWNAEIEKDAESLKSLRLLVQGFLDRLLISLVVAGGLRLILAWTELLEDPPAMGHGPAMVWTDGLMAGMAAITLLAVHELARGFPRGSAGIWSWQQGRPTLRFLSAMAAWINDEPPLEVAGLASDWQELRRRQRVSDRPCRVDLGSDIPHDPAPH